MTEQTFSTWTVQRWNWADEAWETHGTHDDARGEGNAYFSVQSFRASGVTPVRLLKDGVPVPTMSDDPATYYDD